MSSGPELKLDWCSYQAAKYAVERWHYSHRMPKSKLAKIGVWEDDRFIGVIIFGVGATSDLVKQYSLRSTEGCELVRVALDSHSNTVTRMFKVAISMLKRQSIGLRLIVSFADPEVGHVGGIYQGGNWIFTGRTSQSDEYIYRGRRWQGRSFRNKFKRMENHPLVKKVKGSAKLRYLYPLDKAMRRQIEPLRQPYPKRVTSIGSDVPAVQAGEPGASPRVTLSKAKKVKHGT